MVDPRAAPPPAGVKGDVRLLTPQRYEQAVARRSAESRATVPDLELAVDVEVDRVLGLEAKHGCGLTAILMRACALALRDIPRANAAYRDGSFELYSRINIGVVVADDDTYTIPTVFDADKRSLSELAAELTRVTERAVSGELSSPELSGATFTLWDLGPLGVSRATPLVLAPQAAGVSTGAVREVALVRDANVVAGRTITITLACDHRILYGSQAARFLNRITTIVEKAAL